MSVLFAAGATRTTVSVQIKEDTIAERQEVFVALLDSNDENCAMVIHITDNDGMILY